MQKHFQVSKSWRVRFEFLLNVFSGYASWDSIKNEDNSHLLHSTLGMRIWF